jgi:hypothetical protein
MENARKLLKEINQFQNSDGLSPYINVKLSNKYFLAIGYVTFIQEIGQVDNNGFPMIMDRIDDVTKFIQRKPELFKNIIFQIEEEILKGI